MSVPSNIPPRDTINNSNVIVDVDPNPNPNQSTMPNVLNQNSSYCCKRICDCFASVFSSCINICSRSYAASTYRADPTRD